MTTTTTILPGLDLDDAMFERTAQAVADHAPHLEPLLWERFADPAGWTFVPDDDGRAYKAELVLLDTIPAALKANLWFLPDRRGGTAPAPHSHPWAFYSHVLMGGYREDRYRRTADGAVVAELDVDHLAPTVNSVGLNTYHEVTEIHEPGRTLTLMVCGAGQRGRWGYLDVATGEHRRVQPDPHFTARLAALNPHLRTG